jgi:lysozyme family protein
MALFEIAYKKTAVFEGGYANNPNDNGGETFKGIARKFFPAWGGWVVVDKVKHDAPTTFKKDLMTNTELEKEVMKFYIANFWNPIMGDNIVDQSTANNIYDFAVNSGVGRASKYAQTVVGAVADGAIGPKSIDLINTFGATSFVTAYKKARMDFLGKIVQNNPSQKEFLAGWTKRTQNA